MLRGLKYVHSGACNGVDDAAGWTSGSQGVCARHRADTGTQWSCTASLRGRTHAAATCGAANVFHRDLKPKNVLANSDCKLKARVVPAVLRSQLLTWGGPMSADLRLWSRAPGVHGHAHDCLLDGLCCNALVPRARAVRLLLHEGAAFARCRHLQAWLTRAAWPPVRAVHEDD